MTSDDETLARMTAALLAFRDARDWRQFHNPKDQALSLSLEAAELLELMQWKNGDELLDHLREHRAEVAAELADVLGWVLLMAHDLGIDLQASFWNKLAENERKYPADRARGSAAKYTAYEPSGS